MTDEDGTMKMGVGGASVGGCGGGGGGGGGSSVGSENQEGVRNADDGGAFCDMVVN